MVSGSYEIERLVGEGGMGKVYVAKHQRLPRKAAVKVLQPELASDPSMFERFKREAEVASGLGSRHIVHVFDFGFIGQSPFMLMEYLEGRDVETYLRAAGQASPQECIRILEQAVSGLAAAHEKSVIHRDIKPANLFLAREPDGTEVVKVLDFGLSKVRGLSLSLSGANAVGTPAYMSPEQLMASREIDQRTDIYALAVTLFEMLTGHLPFEHPQLTAMCQQIMSDPPPSILAFRTGLDPALQAVMVKALAKDPDQRYSDVREFWKDAHAALLNCKEGQALDPAAVQSMPTADMRSPKPAGTPATVRTPRPGPPGAELGNLATRMTPAATPPRKPVSPARPQAPVVQAEPSSSGMTLLLAAAGIAALLAGGGWLIARSRHPVGPTPAVTVPAPVAVAPVEAPEPAPTTVATPHPIEARPLPAPTAVQPAEPAPAEPAQPTAGGDEAAGQPEASHKGGHRPHPRTSTGEDPLLGADKL